MRKRWKGMTQEQETRHLMDVPSVVEDSFMIRSSWDEGGTQGTPKNPGLADRLLPRLFDLIFLLTFSFVFVVFEVLEYSVEDACIYCLEGCGYGYG